MDSDIGRKGEVYVPFIANLTDDEADILAQMGLDRIQEDKLALIEYAIKSIFEDKIKELDVDIDTSEVDGINLEEISENIDFEFIKNILRSLGEEENGTENNN